MKQQYTIPLAIIMGGLLIAGGVFLKGGAHTDIAAPVYAAERATGGHVWGDPDAPLTIVEFSDFECPFCARLHPTLERIVEESEGRIKWEYRNLPLPSHPNARPAAYAAECVAVLAGNEAYWEYIDMLFTEQRSLSSELYESEAQAHGIAASDLQNCIRDPKIHAIVENDLGSATAHGGSGTPFSVIVYEDGTIKPVSGALPYAHWKPLLGIE